MKRILTFICMFALFVLSSCNEPIYDDGSTTKQSTISNTSLNSQNEITTNTPDNSNTDNNTTSSEENPTKEDDDSVYDDTIPWEPFLD